MWAREVWWGVKQRKDVTVPMPESLNSAIEDELDYGDSKSQWIREAILQRLEREGTDVAEIREDIIDSGNPSKAAGAAD